MHFFIRDDSIYIKNLEKKKVFTYQFYSIKETIHINETLWTKLLNQLSPKLTTALCHGEREREKKIK